MLDNIKIIGIKGTNKHEEIQPESENKMNLVVPVELSATTQFLSGMFVGMINLVDEMNKIQKDDNNRQWVETAIKMLTSQKKEITIENIKNTITELKSIKF